MTIALAMVVIMGMAAVAIDAAGFGFNERRLDQTAADTSVMAGALDFLDPDTVVTEVLAYTQSNLRIQYDPAEWQALWEGCVDSNKPIDFIALTPPAGWAPVDPANWCISQSPSFLRVRIPDQAVETSFGRLIGADTINTSATAVATLQPSGSLNGLMPFAVRGGEGSGEICLQTGPLGLAFPPCTGPQAGSFGAVLSHWIGNGFYSTTPNCRDNMLQGSNNANGILDDNIALGVDHLIGAFDGDVDGDGIVDWSYPRSVNDSNNSIISSEAHVDDCTLSSGVAVATDGVPFNAVLIDTGNSLKDDVTRGLVDNLTFADGDRSRLQKGTNSKIRVRSGSSDWNLDNRPLWTYLLPVARQQGTLVPACDPGNFMVPAANLADLDANNAQMRLCLQNHSTTAGAGVIFKDDPGDTIAESWRFGWAPQLWHDSLGNGLSWRPVYDYRMVYIAGVFFNCSGVSCGLTFYAGHPGPAPLCDPGPPSCKSLEVNQTTAFLLPDAAIPSPIQDSFPIQNLGPFQPRLWR